MLPSQRRARIRAVELATAPPRAPSRTAAICASSNGSRSRRAPRLSFHSDAIASGHGSPVRTVASTNAVLVVTRCKTSAADVSSRSWASSTSTTRLRSPAARNACAAARSRSSTRGARIVPAAGSKPPNAPSGTPEAARVASTSPTSQPCVRRRCAHSRASRLFPTPAAPARTMQLAPPSSTARVSASSSLARPTSGQLPRSMMGAILTPGRPARVKQLECSPLSRGGAGRTESGCASSTTLQGDPDDRRPRRYVRTMSTLRRTILLAALLLGNDRRLVSGAGCRGGAEADDRARARRLRPAGELRRRRRAPARRRLSGRRARQPIAQPRRRRRRDPSRTRSDRRSDRPRRALLRRQRHHQRRARRPAGPRAGLRRRVRSRRGREPPAARHT